MTYDEAVAPLFEAITNSGKNYDLEIIEKACRIGWEAHGKQLRYSGEVYFSHPISVACILVELGMDSESVVAAILHDTIEDTPLKYEDIKKGFGEEIATLVDGVTKLGRIPFSSKEEQQAENIRKMLFAMAKDIRVIIIKLADRLHNMRTIKYLTPKKQREISLETMEIYAPIAHRLGIRELQEEIEDIAISILDPVGYKEIEYTLEIRRNDRLAFIERIKEKIRDRLPNFPNLAIEGRVKSVYGIYRKMFLQGRAFEEIYDIYAVRIITDTVVDCYNILGVIHDMFQPIPNRFKDYISTPKPNMYQSLHSTVISKEGIPFEVQIRTWDMHHTAEYGIAAHWKYKLGISGNDKFEKRLAWIRNILENQFDDAEDIVRTIKTDLAIDDVFVFTPKGDVFSLPSGSTVIDFAYAIHSAVGNRMIGAKVDGRIVPIDYKVQTGEIVEILTTNDPDHGPSRDWLNIVKTGEARNKIRAWFKKERREENIQQGKAEVEREFKRNNIILLEDKMQEFLQNVAKKQRCNSLDDFYASIGYGGISLSKIMQRIKEDYTKFKQQDAELRIEEHVKPDKPRTVDKGVIVEGLENCLFRFSRCCNPVPGDDIIGFITRGYGVSIHKRDCINVPQNLSEASEPERWVNAHWSERISDTYKSTLKIVGTQNQSLLAEITLLFANSHIKIHAINAHEGKGGKTIVLVTLRVNDIEHLNTIISRLKTIRGVLSVERANA